MKHETSQQQKERKERDSREREEWEKEEGKREEEGGEKERRERKGRWWSEKMKEETIELTRLIGMPEMKQVFLFLFLF